MRACQLCGCSSWGPIGDPAEIARMTEFALDLPAGAYVRCDNCKAIARRDLMRDVPESTPAAPPDAGFPLDSFIKPVMATLMPGIPVPPTRLERLTVALLRSGMFAKPDGWGMSSLLNQADKPSILVEVARHLESQLDQPTTSTTDPTAKQPWLTLSFPAREEFERWFTGLLDAVNQADHIDFTTTQDYPPKWYEAAVNYALGKRHGGENCGI